MKKLASWYRKWDKELETQFTFALLVLNFMTNVLILCGLYLFFVLPNILFLFPEMGFFQSILALFAYSVQLLPYAFITAILVPNIFVLMYAIRRWSHLRLKEAEEEAKKDLELFENREESVEALDGGQTEDQDSGNDLLDTKVDVRKEDPNEESLAPAKKKNQKYTALLWLGLFGSFFEAVIIFIVKDMTFHDWSERLINSQKHALIWSGAYPTFFTFAALALLALIIYSYRDANSLSPLLNVFCISGILGGLVLLAAFDFQLQLVSLHTLFLVFYSLNLLDIRIREWQENRSKIRYENRLVQRCQELLNKSRNWPWIAALLALPTLALVVLILMLFGQQPDSVIKAWTNTADWTFSGKIPPQNLIIDEHYLCTVAAGGHEKVVKPQRMGVRHGHPVVVNRQLCIANAFEQVLEEKTPRFHRFLRRNYDRYGYPFAKHIKKKWAMDLIYYLMKPLEWIFLLVLYLVDRKPENRIAMQYIQPIPDDFDPKKAS